MYNSSWSDGRCATENPTSSIQEFLWRIQCEGWNIVILQTTPVLMTLKEENPGEYINLMDDIEIQKCSFDLKRTRSTITFMLPVNLLNAYEEELKCNFEEVLRKTIFKEDVQIKRCKLAITKRFFTTFFQPYLDNVVRMIKDILTDPSLTDVSTLLEVGGCDESPFIRETLQSSFPNKNVYTKWPKPGCTTGSGYLWIWARNHLIQFWWYTYWIAKLFFSDIKLSECIKDLIFIRLYQTCTDHIYMISKTIINVHLIKCKCDKKNKCINVYATFILWNPSQYWVHRYFICKLVKR